MRFARLLRLTAIGIALMCWLDPASSIAPPPPVLVDAAIVRSSRDGRPARDGSSQSVLDHARQLTDALAGQIGRDGTVRVHEVAENAPLPCDAAQPCVVLTDGAPVAVPPDRKGPLTVVPLGQTLTGNVEVVGVSTEAAHLDGQAVARVALDGRGVQGRTTRVRLRDGKAIVGEVAHTWSADGQVALEVPWWPVATGERRLTAEAVIDGGDLTSLDNAATASVSVTAERWPVAVLERRPSWSTTFVRRALEDDRRFEVRGQTDLAPRVSVRAAGGLDSQQLDPTRVVIVGAPDALTADDVARLEVFVRQRGGAVLLVPDRVMAGPVARLLRHAWHEHVDREPSAAGSLRGSEWLAAAGVTPLDRVWAESPHGPAIVSTPIGAGTVLVSGALDAWRYRAGDGAFDRFWRATVAGLAGGAGNVIDVQLSRSTPGDGGEVSAHVQGRTVRPPTEWQVSATRTCADGAAAPLRLWPSDAAGAFTGRVPMGGRSDCRVAIRMAGLGEAGAAARIASAGVSSQRWSLADMERLAARAGGRVVRDADFAPVVQGWLDSRGRERRPEPRYPMRSWLWLLPLTGCLAGEWWLRRRAGWR